MKIQNYETRLDLLYAIPAMVLVFCISTIIWKIISLQKEYEDLLKQGHSARLSMQVYEEIRNLLEQYKSSQQQGEG